MGVCFNQFCQRIRLGIILSVLLVDIDIFMFELEFLHLVFRNRINKQNNWQCSILFFFFFANFFLLILFIFFPYRKLEQLELPPTHLMLLNLIIFLSVFNFAYYSYWFKWLIIPLNPNYFRFYFFWFF